MGDQEVHVVRTFFAVYLCRKIDSNVARFVSSSRFIFMLFLMRVF